MNGLLVCFGSSTGKNIGDYIQSVAQEQFLDNIDCYCEREELNKIDSPESINLIMNGWFMWNPENFPPAKSINPLFVSFHLVPSISESFFTPQTVNYLKRYEPIGARDIGTKKILEAHGIKSYYSSCLTLTLNLKYLTEKKSEEIIFVDPFYEVSGTRKNLFNIILYFKSIKYLIKYRKETKAILNNFESEYHTIWRYISRKLERMVAVSHFYNDYKEAFDDSLLQKAVVISHKVEKSKYPTNDAMMAYARDLIRRYAKAKLVITSRIHCALPCLAVETPVLYVQSSNLESIQMRSPGRMEGIINLFHVLYYDKKVIRSQEFGKIRPGIAILNKSDYKKYRDMLIDTVKSFIKRV